MKPLQLPAPFRIAFVALTALVPAAVADDGFYNKFGLDLGYAGRTHDWAIYTYGAGTSSSPFTALDVSSPSKLNGYQVDGDIALAGAYSRLNVSGWGSVSGDRYEQTTSSESRSGDAVIAGSRFSNTATNTLLNGGVNSLKNVSLQAAALTATAGSPTSMNLAKGSNAVFDNNPFAGKYVMNLTNFVMGGGSTLTLKGVEGSAFVLNISGNFSIAGASQILLKGGLTPSDVLFNVTGNGGKTFEIGGDSLFTGTLLAYNKGTDGQRTLNITGHDTLIDGELIANKVSVQSGSRVKEHPHKKSKK